MLPSSLVAHAVIEAVLARSVSGRPRLIGDFLSFDVQVPARARVFVGERRSWNNDRLPGFREEMQQSGLLSCSVQSTATSTAVHRRPPPCGPSCFPLNILPLLPTRYDGCQSANLPSIGPDGPGPPPTRWRRRPDQPGNPFSIQCLGLSRVSWVFLGRWRAGRGRLRRLLGGWGLGYWPFPGILPRPLSSPSLLFLLPPPPPHSSTLLSTSTNPPEFLWHNHSFCVPDFRCLPSFSSHIYPFLIEIPSSYLRPRIDYRLNPLSKSLIYLYLHIFDFQPRE